MTARAAIVTGGSRGIGFGVAEALAQDGYGMTIAARDPDRLKEAAQALEAGGASVLPVAVDVGEAEGLHGLVGAHRERFGRLDVLVASAGTGTAGPLADYPADRLDRALAVNVRAPLLLSQAALPLLRDAGREHGSAWIVLLGSLSGKVATPRLGVYSASKAAVASLAQSLNQEHAGDGVRAAVLCPGYVDTDMARWVHDRVPPEEMIAAEDLAETVRYLLRLSPRAVVSEIVLSRAGAPPCLP